MERTIIEQEYLNIFNKRHESIGIASRSDVHAKGLWHETFHFWLLTEKSGITYLHFQLRSNTKKDFPALLDITAAGHLLAEESPQDGVRELEEELGISIPFEKLTYAGVLPDVIKQANILDREFCHVYLYNSRTQEHDFHLQKEEVAGLYRAPLHEVIGLFTGERETLTLHGFEIDENGMRHDQLKEADTSHFVPHESAYFDQLFHIIQQIL
ncbi:NUDIX hydrolase [Bacillus sp. NPDC077027]|uniref:NUDIX hydrolase n=1 Tax=Bacillus sp. NPDC077027 TaxID=3390548 RepID=UPI003D05CC42